ncbi:hypothetical protein FRC20_004395 [Serendipita sp. 405]|nr:hypothetical protein FRC20_004395 [Serendipita sp. 405]
MDPNGQAIAHSYAYYSSGDEGPVVEDYSTGVAYAHQPVQHQYTMQSAGVDINQVHAPMQLQMQPQQPHPTYMMHPSVPVTHVQYPMNNTGIVYHQAMTSPPPPPSPYDPVSPGPSDHSGTESIGATPIRAGGVPVMPSRVYHTHSHSHSSQSSTSSLHGESHPYAAPIMPYNPVNVRRHSKTNSLDRRSISTTPPPNQFHASDDDFDRGDVHDPYINQVTLLNRKESTRRQRIQAEQRRRDELRDGYSRLRDVLPPSNSKSSKVSLIERARSHILDMNDENTSLKDQVEQLKKEVQRLQQISDQIALSVAVPLNTTRPPVVSSSPPMETSPLPDGSKPVAVEETAPTTTTS